MASNSSLSCVYDSLTGQGTDDVIPEGTCLHGSVTSLFRGSLDGRCHTYHGNTCQRNKDNIGSSLSCVYDSKLPSVSNSFLLLTPGHYFKKI